MPHTSHKTILFFSPTPSHPQSAGNRARIYNLAKALQETGFKIIFVYYTQEGLNKRQQELMEEEWDKFYSIEKNTHAKFPHKGYYLVDDWYQEGLGETIREIAIKHAIDIFLCSYIFQSKILDFIPSYITKIIDTHDRFSDRHFMLQSLGLKPDFFYTVASQESIALQRADRIFAIQEKEAEFFASITNKEIKVLGHIQAKHFLPQKHIQEKFVVGVVGSANSVNTLSMQKFLDLFIKTKEPSIQLKIAGSLCKNLAIKHPNVELLGYVEDIQAFYDEVDIVINPLVLGTGLKIKTVEALSYAKPILSTAIGFEGIRTSSPLHLHQDLEALLSSLLDVAKQKEILIPRLYDLSKEIFISYSQQERKKLQTYIAPKKETMPILIITHIDFWNQNLGSKNRLFDLVKHLLEKLEVLVLYINPKRSNDQDTINRLGLSKNVLFAQELETSQDVDIAPLHEFIQKHSVLQSFVDENLYKKMATFLNHYTFEKVIVEYIHLSYFFPLFRGAQTYLDTHDIMFKRYETFKQNNQKHWIEITKDEEFALFNEYNYILSIQKHEHRFLQENKINSLLVPYSFKITKQKKLDSKKAIIFIGGNTLANQDSVKWFLQNIWDLFIPCDYTFEVYGDICHSVQENRKKKIFTKGRIDDLDTLYSYNDLIAINPVHIGGGLKIKNVEALCSSLALLTTSQGAFGLEDGIGEAFLVADTVDTFKDKLLALIVSKKLRDALAYNAVKYAQKNFHSDVCYAKLIQLLQEKEGNK
jgi:glycosyltransferase involved in cell wall biosynthesis